MRLKIYSMAAQDNHGYGRIGRRIPLALQAAGATILKRLEMGWDARVLIGTPDSFLLDHPQPDLIFHTMWEAEPLPPSWLPVLQNAGALWVPSRFVEKVLREAGYEGPVIVAGYGVDPAEYSYVERPRTGNERYTFLAWARTMVDRKRTLDVIKAFAKADLPGSQLIVKHNFNLGTEHHDGFLAKLFPLLDVADFNGSYEQVPIQNVHILTGDLPPAEMTQLLAMADCMVYPGTAEGFGLMPLEMMATGGLVIAPACSGLAEFVSPETNLVLPHGDLVEARTLSEIWGSPAYVPSVNNDDLVALMTYAYEHRREAAALGKAAAERVARYWTWEHAGARALDAIMQCFHIS